MSQSGSSKRTPDGVLATGEGPIKGGHSADGQVPEGNNAEVGESSAANNNSEDAVGEDDVNNSGEVSSDSDEERDDDVVLEVEVEEPVQLNFDDPPDILKEQLKVNHKYYKVKFAECGVKVSCFQAGAGNVSAYHYYRCTSEAGLCTGANGF
ncbi:hypothetical protein COLO4_36654 [Corchorus olitorius]|uniref:Uncharacterized protein n=1 Tax=Corchorus olitorius TaxID=93759 RepID=A0A1R3G737_9ROSI|nr:hypothetical protein COLO4_36654 [Corchorus olitorius]